MSQIIAPVIGFIAKINVNVGDQIKKDQIVAMVQCMKTEIPVLADVDGVVSEITIPEGDEVNLGDVILVVS